MEADKQIAEALLGAASYREGADKHRRVVIRRAGKELFAFEIAPIDEDVMQRCRRENLKNRGRRNEELDGARFVSQLIYEATVEEDRKRLWQNRAVMEQLNCATGADVIQKVLTPAERSKLEEVLLTISSYDDDLDDMIKKV